MKEVKTFWILIGLLMATHLVKAQSFIDEPFFQPVSRKYIFQEGQADAHANLLIDRDDNVYVLTNEGFYILLEGQMVPNRQYRPLQGKKPIDVSIQSKAGILYYLYDDHYLTNAHVGKPFGSFSSGIYSQIAINAQGVVMLTGKKNYALMNNGKRISGKIAEDILETKANGNDFYILTSRGI